MPLPYVARRLANADAVARVKANATQRAQHLSIVNILQASGLTSVRSIARALNDQGISAPRGDTWHPTAVSQLLRGYQKDTTAAAHTAPPRPVSRRAVLARMPRR